VSSPIEGIANAAVSISQSKKRLPCLCWSTTTDCRSNMTFAAVNIASHPNDLQTNSGVWCWIRWTRSTVIETTPSRLVQSLYLGHAELNAVESRDVVLKKEVW